MKRAKRLIVGALLALVLAVALGHRTASAEIQCGPQMDWDALWYLAIEEPMDSSYGFDMWHGMFGQWCPQYIFTLNVQWEPQWISMFLTLDDIHCFDDLGACINSGRFEATKQHYNQLEHEYHLVFSQWKGPPGY